MFKIKHDCDILERYAKVHFASTKAVAEEIVSDLSNRFSGTFECNDEEENECMWDPGGMMLADDEVFTFRLTNDMHIMCKAQHFNHFVEHIKRYEPRGDNVKYIKIHGHWTCICLTVQEFAALKLIVSDPDFVSRAEVAWEERERRLNLLERQGHVVRAIEGEDGQLYKRPAPVAIDKKLLN